MVKKDKEKVEEEVLEEEPTPEPEPEQPSGDDTVMTANGLMRKLPDGGLTAIN